MINFSLVVPFFNEEKIIEKTYKEVKRRLDKCGLSYEIIFVNDGSTDNSRVLVEKAIFEDRNSKLVSYLVNRGRGYALQSGFKKAAGKIVGYIDSDLEINPDYIGKCLKEIWNYDSVIVSKHLAGSKIKTTFLRKFASLVFNYLVRLSLGLRISDTQAGLKLFRKDKLDTVLSKVKSEGWLFDVELLYFFSKEGFSIKEIPIEISFGEGRIRKSFIIDFVKSFWFVWKLKNDEKERF